MAVCVSGLTTLDLHDNCVERMPLELGQLSRLKKLNLSHNRYRTTMDQISIKTPNPKCRLYWCLIECIDWRYSQSCWYFLACELAPL
jgi:hypothetical protein